MLIVPVRYLPDRTGILLTIRKDRFGRRIRRPVQLPLPAQFARLPGQRLGQPADRIPGHHRTDRLPAPAEQDPVHDPAADDHTRSVGHHTHLFPRRLPGLRTDARRIPSRPVGLAIAVAAKVSKCRHRPGRTDPAGRSTSKRSAPHRQDDRDRLPKTQYRKPDRRSGSGLENDPGTPPDRSRERQLLDGRQRNPLRRQPHAVHLHRPRQRPPDTRGERDHRHTALAGDSRRTDRDAHQRPPPEHRDNYHLHHPGSLGAARNDLPRIARLHRHADRDTNPGRRLPEHLSGNTSRAYRSHSGDPVDSMAPGPGLRRHSGPPTRPASPRRGQCPGAESAGSRQPVRRRSQYAGRRRCTALPDQPQRAILAAIPAHLRPGLPLPGRTGPADRSGAKPARHPTDL